MQRTVAGRGPSPIALFAYGSLVDPLSAAMTLGRDVERVQPARLLGWRRRFSQARDNLRTEKTFARAHDETIPAFVLGLNVEPQAEAGEEPNGILIEVTAAELDRLDLREQRYDRTELEPAALALAAGGRPDGPVVTYVAKPAQLATEPPPGAVILASYAERVEAAFAALGDAELDTYRRTTLPYPVEVVAGRLVVDRIPEGNPRDW